MSPVYLDVVEGAFLTRPTLSASRAQHEWIASSPLFSQRVGTWFARYTSGFALLQKKLVYSRNVSKCWLNATASKVLGLHIAVNLESWDWQVLDNIRTSKALDVMASLRCMNLMFTLERHDAASRRTWVQAMWCNRQFVHTLQEQRYWNSIGNWVDFDKTAGVIPTCGWQMCSISSTL